MLGICYFSPRRYLVYDFKDMRTSINDMYWTSVVMRDVEKWVVPSKNYAHLPCSKKGLFTNKEIRKYKCNYYTELFNKYYKTANVEHGHA